MSSAVRTGLSAALLIAGLTTPVIAADFPRKTPVRPANAVDRCTKIQPPKGTPEVPGGDIFGFTSPTDIGDPCNWSFASENTGLVGKRDGSFFALFTKSEIAYTYSENLAFAFSAFTAYNKWSNVTILQDALASAGAGVTVTGLDKLQFDGLSGEVLLRLVTRSPGQPFALTASVEPRWSRIDLSSLTGYPAEFYAGEFKMLLDVALTERLFAAMNVIYALGTQKYDIPGANWVNNSLTSISAALTGRIYAAENALVEGVFLGAEARLLSSFAGLALNQNLGNAFFVGPTFAIAFQGGSMLNFVWTPQVAGRAFPASAPGPLDLDNFDRHHFRVKFETSLK
ncbi:MAG TPA: hypothetical protein VFO74_14525 [Pseudolabrys sp.]|nr:hypothetical protein [Pseudolabrys sp.]